MRIGVKAHQHPASSPDQRSDMCAGLRSLILLEQAGEAQGDLGELFGALATQGPCLLLPEDLLRTSQPGGVP